MVSLLGYLEEDYLAGPSGYLNGLAGETTGMQVDMEVQEEPNVSMQVLMATVDEEAPVGMQAKLFPLQHWLHPKYLYDTDPYLTESYLAAKMCAFQGMQVDQKIGDQENTGMQVQQKIDNPEDDEFTGMQVDMLVNEEENTGMQVELVNTNKLGIQVNMSIYNITQLRILCEFPSRGLAKQYGTETPSEDNENWFTNAAMESGDLGKLGNLNTDVLEQRIQTDDGVTTAEFRCDTGKPNTFVNTLAILEHNITTSATITVQASDDEDFSSVKFQFTVNPTSPYAIYIAPTLPTTPARYWSITISDPQNGDNHLKVGTIIFGNSSIFSLKECFENPVIFGKRHFKDEIETEGFTNTSNDRATRRILSLKFNRLDVEGGNYQLLQEYFDFAKTDLKCLIIPTPTKPTVLTVFSKLVQLPEEQHDAIDVQDNELNAHFATLDLDWDESR